MRLAVEIDALDATTACSEPGTSGESQRGPFIFAAFLSTSLHSSGCQAETAFASYAPLALCASCAPMAQDKVRIVDATSALGRTLQVAPKATWAETA